VKLPRIIIDERGFTIQEILVVLLISSLIVSFCLSLFVFIYKYYISWESKNNLRTAVSSDIQTISYDVLRSTMIREMTDSTLVLIKGSGKEVSYCFAENRITRNDVVLCPDNVIKMSVKLSLKSDQIGSRALSGLLGIKILGKYRTWEYSAETNLVVPRSGREEFIGSMTD
jgi:prepilin-type N-terminal cleavage/methylation domain-containing protein